MREICRREYKFDTSARLVGKTLYADIAPQKLVGADLGLDRKTVERLYDALLTVTRVALSTDAKVDFLVVRAKDANTGVIVTLLRSVPDIKWYFYMRISRADFENRGVMEIDSPEGTGKPDDSVLFHDVTNGEFMARLTASRLQQKISYNPLVSVFLRVHRVKGTFADGALTIVLDKFQRLGGAAAGVVPPAVPPVDTSNELLRRSVVEAAGDVVEKYDDAKSVQRLRVVEDNGQVLFDFSREELLAARKKIPRKKIWEEEES